MFEKISMQNGISYNKKNGIITINYYGIYQIFPFVYGASQCSIYKNDILLTPSTFNSVYSGNQFIYKLKKNDILQIKNTSNIEINTNFASGGSNPSFTSQVTIFKI